MIDNLYETIGGKRTISAATDAFYRRVLEDESTKAALLAGTILCCPARNH
jgi:truncated hemoglobin YjbI